MDGRSPGNGSVYLAGPQPEESLSLPKWPLGGSQVTLMVRRAGQAWPGEGVTRGCRAGRGGVLPSRAREEPLRLGGPGETQPSG